MSAYSAAKPVKPMAMSDCGDRAFGARHVRHAATLRDLSGHAERSLSGFFAAQLESDIR